MDTILFVAMVVLIIALLTALFWVFVLEKRIAERRRHFLWIMDASDMYLFEHDIAHDELWFSPQCAKLMDVPTRVKNFKQVTETTKDSTLKRGLSVANKVLACTKDSSRLELLRTDGRMGIFEVTSKDFHNAKGELMSRVGILVDITRSVREKEALERDALTGIYNEGTTRFLIERSIREQQPLQTGAYVLLDIDQFDEIQKRHGREAGERVLKALSNNLHFATREGDILGRLSGNVFCLYLPSTVSYDTLYNFCERMNRVAESTMTSQNIGFDATISVGGVMIHEGDDYASVAERARKTLAAAKNQGKNTCCVAD